MELHELRIGNWVEDLFGNVHQVTVDDYMRMQVNGMDNPIRLTLEWLERTEFEKVEWDEWEIEIGNDLSLSLILNKKGGFDVQVGSGVEWSDILVRVDTVHHLQNVYWSLALKELSFS